MKLFPKLLVVLTLFFAVSSCQKIEGPGGSSKISGSIIAQIDDGFGGVAGTYSPVEEDVYIIYGGDAEDTYFDDDVKTSFDGSFEFEYLEKGTYRIFVYSKDNTVFGGKTVVMQEVEITDKKQTVELTPFTIWK